MKNLNEKHIVSTNCKGGVVPNDNPKNALNEHMFQNSHC